MRIKKNMLTFIENVGYDNKRRIKAKYICDCGKECIKNKCDVNNGNTKSCGCLKAKWGLEFGLKSRKHGLSKHPLHKVWDGIKERCYNPNSINYHNYGGRGVMMCESWRTNFKEFYDWCIENGWQHGLEIDKDKKIKNNLIYSPDTCSIITSAENANYTRANTIIEFNGDNLPLNIIAKKYNITAIQLSNRLAKGWSIKDALTRPLIKRTKVKNFISYSFGHIN